MQAEAVVVINDFLTIGQGVSAQSAQYQLSALCQVVYNRTLFLRCSCSSAFDFNFEKFVLQRFWNITSNYISWMIRECQPVE